VTSVLEAIEALVAGLGLPVLEAWGGVAYLAGVVLALAAYGGFTFRVDGRPGLGRERLAWDAKAVLSIPVTFLLVVATGYLGSFVVLVPGAQTLESLKDLMVFLCIVLFGYPALLTVPFAYGLSDLVEGVPPGSLFDWLPGYFINPACFWLAYQLLGADPDFRRARTWPRYLAFVALFTALEPMLWGHICADEFGAAVSYANVSSALFFTTGMTWVLAPVAMLVALPLARRYGMFWAEIPLHLQVRRLRSREWRWLCGGGGGANDGFAVVKGWPIRMTLMAPFMALVFLAVATTAYASLRSARTDASRLALRLHEQIADNIELRLAPGLAAGRGDRAALQAQLGRSPIAGGGLALIVDGARTVVAGSVPRADPAARAVLEAFLAAADRRGRGDGVVEINTITEKPLTRTSWLARATPLAGGAAGAPAGWLLLTAMPESYYLAGFKTGSSRSAMIVALALALTLALGSALAAQVTGRLRELSAATRALAHGQLDVRVPRGGFGELGLLARSFNEMAERLDMSIDELRLEVEVRTRREQELSDSEAKVRSSEDRLRLAARAGKLAIWDWDVEHDRLLWDDAMFALYDVRPEAFSGTFEAWSGCLAPEDLARATAEVQAALRGEGEFASEFAVRLTDGSTRVIEGVANTIRDEHGRPLRMVGINWDITEQRRMRQLLAAETLVLEMIATGKSLDEVLHAVAANVEAMSPGTLASVLLIDAQGRSVAPVAAPSLPPAFSRAIDQAPIGPRAGSCGTAAHRREPVVVTDIERDPLWEDYRALAREHGLRACWSAPILGAGRAVLGTFAMYYREVRSPTPEDFRVIERAAHLAGVAIERRALEDQFRQAQKMEAVGHLAAGVAHDFNNLLTVIRSYADCLDADRAPRDDRDAILAIRDAGERATGLTRQLLAFSRKTVLQPRVVDVNAEIRNTETMLRRVIGEDVRLETALAPDVKHVKVDPGQLTQVLMNLAVNARDAMPGGGAITITTGNQHLDEAYCRLHGDARPGPHVVVTVADTGTGMTPEVRARIFEPFFTTKGVGKGTGLGLATVHGIVRQSGGHIVVASEEGRGASFSLCLPGVDAAVDQRQAPAAAVPRGPALETILLVEDDPAVRNVALKILQNHGYRVLVGTDGRDAVDVAEQHQGMIDLMITDVVMPGLSGRLVADALRARRPQLRVLYTSGYTDDSVVLRGVLQDEVAFLAKPFTPSELTRKVREVLDARPAPRLASHPPE
jgi:PAS domain S-box-containing protein